LPKSKAMITTDRQVAALKPGEKTYEAPIAGVRGLAVRVFPSGAKAWELRYVSKGGTRRRMPLGEYPGLSLAKASARAGALRVSVVDGKDPAAERIAERRRARTGDTLDELAEAYFTAAVRGLHGGRGRPKRESTIAIERARFKGHIAPALGSRRFAEVGRSDVKQFMRELASGSLAPDTVASVGRTLSAILGFAVHEERIDANPAAGLTQPLALRTRDRMFSDKAIKEIWAALTIPLPPGCMKPPREAEAGGKRRAWAEPVIALALRFALLTLTRRADVAGAEWSEFDFATRTWTVPGARHKSRRPHVVPLAEQAIEVLREAAKLSGPAGRVEDLREGFVFASQVKSGHHVDDHAITRALARICRDLELPRGSPHDFRRVGATHLTGERLGFRRFVVSKVLGHAAHEGAVVTAVYDRNEYLSEKRRALEAWEGLLLEITGERARPPNVTAMREAIA
jgi:integrase